MKLSVRPLIVLTALVAIVAHTGCSGNARNNWHLSRANKYAKAGQYDRAEIEYIKVLQATNSTNAEALAGLGLLYFEQGRVGRVFSFLDRAREVQPDNLAVRNKLGSLYISAGKPKEARTEALFILERQPNDDEAPVLLAESSHQPNEIEDARRRLNALPRSAERVPVVVALGLLDLKQRNTAAAAAAFERARSLDANASLVHLGFASLHRAANEPEKAREALAAAAKHVGPRSNIRLEYVNALLQSGQAAAARAELDGIVKAAPDYLPAYLALAELNSSENKPDEALALVDKVLAREPVHPNALSLRARCLMAKGDAAKAAENLERAVGMFTAPQLSYQLGLAQLKAGDFQKAVAAFSDTLRQQPDSPAATMGLATALSRQGSTKAAIDALKPLTEKRPQLIEPRVTLANIYLQDGSYDEALVLLAQLDKAQPNNPQFALQSALALGRLGRAADARAALERALTIDPGHLQAIEHLTNLDLAENKPADALARLQAKAAAKPSVPLYVLMAKVHGVMKDTTATEGALQKAIETDPQAPLPYVLLAQHYISTKQQAKAVASLETVNKAKPDEAAPIMMLAVLYNQQGNYKAAREYYEKLLVLDPKFSPALNNLAYLYSEQFNEPEKAFEMAQRARAALPTEPHTADTLGWILYKRGQYAWALNLLKESAERLTDSYEIQYHLGMTHYMLGEEAAARTALERAVKSKEDFPGAEDARLALDTLTFDPTSADSAAVAALEKRTGTKPDPVALVRLGAVYERANDRSRALKAYEDAMKLSPNNVGASLGAARVYRKQNDTAKAMELIKAIRKVAPNDASVGLAQGELAMEMGDYRWAYSLLQEIARGDSAAPEARLAFAQASYHTGNTAAAERVLSDIVADSPNFGRLAEASEFLELIRLSSDGTKALAAADRIERLAKSESAPAMMALGALHVQRNEGKSALEVYRRLLQRYPLFAPAQRELTLLQADAAEPDNAALELAAKAREAFPSDALVAKAYGVLLYKKGNFQRAATLLEESARSRADDAELLYYLGAAQGRNNNRPASVAALRKSLELNLRADLAANARQLLAEAN